MDADYIVNCGLNMSRKVVLFASIVTETLLVHLAPRHYEDQEHCPVSATPLNANQFFWLEANGLSQNRLEH
jgi:hypothetical protein